MAPADRTPGARAAVGPGVPARLAVAFDAAPSGMAVLDRSGRIVAANQHVADLVGRTTADLVGTRGSDHTSVEDRERTRVRLADLLEGRIDRLSIRADLTHADGRAIPVTLTAARVPSEQGGGGDMVLHVEDHRRLLEVEAQVDYLSRHDATTGLPNRTAITDRIGEALRGAGEHRPVAVLAVDLDRFQAVNDRLGHAYGDHVLATIGSRLAAVLGHGNAGRLGADEFVGVIAAVRDVDEALRTADAVRAAVAQPIEVADVVLHVSCTVGVALEPSRSAPPGALVQRADIALHRGRRAGRTVDVADEQDAIDAVRQLDVEAEATELVRGDRLDVAFQPIQSVDGRIVGVEALVRPVGTDTSPGAFIAAAERSELIIDVGRIVLDRALAAMPALDRAAGRPLVLSVNLSARQLHDPSTAEAILAAAARHGHPTEQLCVELTETAAMSNPDATIATLTLLRDAGVRVAMDDFGIGYSSFSYLRDLPIDEVKVDMSFLHRAAVDPGARKVMEGMISLCQGMGLETVCEGVEDEHHREVAVAAGCTRWQGYHSSRPLPAAELCAVLARPQPVRPVPVEGLAPLLTRLGLADLLVFHRVGVGRWAHIGGVGRGEGWAGIVEVDLAHEPFLAQALIRRDRVRLSSSEPIQVVGPYYATTALVVVRGDALVVLGHPVDEVAIDVADARVDHLVDLAIATVRSVSPAKPLADELEVLQAVQELLRFPGGGRVEALRHLLRTAVDALSCDLGVAHVQGLPTVAVGTAAPIDGARLTAALGDLPRARQLAGPDDLPDGLVERLAVRSWYAMPLAHHAGVVLVAHSAEAPRGFTTLCQRLGLALVEAGEVVLSAAERDPEPSVESAGAQAS
jgi:diguanylate cyclase (GGDEF)-like protein/PAS domain S-box-containing protein